MSCRLEEIIYYDDGEINININAIVLSKTFIFSTNIHSVSVENIVSIMKNNRVCGIVNLYGDNSYSMNVNINGLEKSITGIITYFKDDGCFIIVDLEDIILYKIINKIILIYNKYNNH